MRSYRKGLEVVRRKQKVGNPCFTQMAYSRREPLWLFNSDYSMLACGGNVIFEQPLVLNYY